MKLLGSKIHTVSVLKDVALGLQGWLCVKYLRVAVSSIPDVKLKKYFQPYELNFFSFFFDFFLQFLHY